MPDDLPIRKIIHVDMDAFYASVAQMDNPELKGKPIAVGGGGTRGVISAASYEARKFGVKSAMTGRLAIKLCPDLIFVKTDFERYKTISKQRLLLNMRFCRCLRKIWGGTRVAARLEANR